jgi:hypothetical protein
MLDELIDEKESLLRKIESDKQEVCTFHSKAENDSKSTFFYGFQKQSKHSLSLHRSFLSIDVDSHSS